MDPSSTFVASVHLTSGEGYAQQIRAGHHTLVADEPEAQGGKDTGPAPFALVLSGLAACTSITLAMYAAKKGWTLGPLRVDLRLFRENEAMRVERTLHFDPAITAEQRASLAAIAEKTPVTRALRAGFTIDTTVAAE
jgi:putative redox protein